MSGLLLSADSKSRRTGSPWGELQPTLHFQPRTKLRIVWSRENKRPLAQRTKGRLAKLTLPIANAAGTLHALEKVVRLVLPLPPSRTHIDEYVRADEQHKQDGENDRHDGAGSGRFARIWLSAL